MSGKERRRYTRVPVALPVRLYVKGQREPIEAEVKNISVGGAFVKCSEMLPAGQNVLLEFKLAELDLIHAKVTGEDPPAIPTDKEHTEPSVVRWIQRISEGGFGVEFVELRPDIAKFITDLVAYCEKMTT